MFEGRHGTTLRFTTSYRPTHEPLNYFAWLVGCTLCGVLLFFFAGKLCRSTLFYYVAGISVGVLISISIIFIIVGRLFVKDFVFMVFSIAAGSSLTLWFMKWLWVNHQMSFEFYQEYVIGYLVCSALLSFAVCYYFGPGPFTNERLLDLIKWFLQGVAFLIIYFGIHSTVISYAVIGVLLVSQVATYYWSHVRR